MDMLLLKVILVASTQLNYVHDGDTVGLKTVDGLEVKGRLIGIDCPEVPSRARNGRKKGPGQPGGEAARDRLQEILKPGFSIKTYGSDAYGRSLVELILKDQRVVNIVMVEEGFCEVYQRAAARKGLRFDLGPYRQAEAKARSAKKGIWGYQHYEPPTTYRKRLQN